MEAILKQFCRVSEAEFEFSSCHDDGDQNHAVLFRGGGQALEFRLAGGTGFQARGVGILL